MLFDKNDPNKIKLSPHLGYPNFIPLSLGMIDPSDDFLLSKHAQALRNTTTLWSLYGIRSLSKADPDFGTSSNYWRGPVWINIHYMILKAIKLYYWDN